VRGKSRAALAKRFGVSTRTIDSIILRETWKHLA
jgi:transposase